MGRAPRSLRADISSVLSFLFVSRITSSEGKRDMLKAIQRPKPRLFPKEAQTGTWVVRTEILDTTSLSS